MSALLADAIRRQSLAPTATIDATVETSERALDAAAALASRPLGVAVLAWCQEHPAAIGHHSALVENLRRAIACKALIGSHLVALWAAIPDVVDVRARSEA